MLNDPSQLAGKRLAAYVRVSSDKQDADRQIKSIEEWAERNGLTVAQWFKDTTGRNPRDKAGKRVDFQRLLKAVEAGEVQAVIVDSQDRFGTKNAYEFGKYISQLAEHGCPLWSVAQGNLSSDDPATILTSTVGAITSTREQEEKAHRNISGKIQKAKDGEYQGGYPPFGLDVVCFDSAGREKWRVVYDGHYSRLKLTKGKRDGERYDGKDNFPAKDLTDVLRVRPSVRKDRIKTVQQIFQWYDEESISPSQVASRLNKLDVDSVFGTNWNKQKIKNFLGNPVYTGLPTFNKRGGSRFAEYVGGRVQQVRSVNGKVVLGRKRQPADYVQPDKPAFHPIVSAELFNRVQEKLRASSQKHANPNRKAGRTASLWLRNFLVCGKCGKPMRAQASTKARNVVSYACGTYGTYGKNNPTGCRCHRVKADVLHKIVEDYLVEANKKIAALLAAEQDHDLVWASAAAGEFCKKHEEIYDLMTAMHSQVDRYMDQQGHKAVMQEYAADTQQRIVRGLTKQIDGLGPFSDLYEFVHQRRKPELERELARLNAEHNRLVDGYADLPAAAGRARAKAQDRIVTIESQLKAVEDELRNVADEVEAIIGDLMNRRRAIHELEKTVTSDSAFRKKAALLGQVVDRIVCHFRYSDGNGKTESKKSYLDSVEIFPHEGDPVNCFPKGIKPAPD